MPTWSALLPLLLAAVLEAGGDAVVRGGLTAKGLLVRCGLIVLGGLLLTLYGVFVNTPRWDFGRLLGVYVAFFFVVAQVINAVVFKVAPSGGVVIGGALIIAGGLVLTLWRQGA
jgi:small multidrug resistance family-3 protein